MKELSIEERKEISKLHGGVKAYFGLRLRPYSLGVAPKGVSAVLPKEQALALFANLRDTNNIRHGVIAYPSALSEADANAFDLIPLCEENGIELKYINSIPKGELQVKLIEMLAEYFYSLNDAYIIAEIEGDGEYELMMAFKQLPVFTNRKVEPQPFAQYRECLRTLHEDAVVARLIELNRKAA
ncbi:MAG: hypothetical protein ACI936_002044 [Paraglaciecola sp.]|jgi:hypothetical protein